MLIEGRKLHLKFFGIYIFAWTPFTTPCDYGSRHPPPKNTYSRQEKEALGVEEEEDDMEIIVNRVQHGYMPDAVTISVLQHFTKEDTVLSQLAQDVQKGKLRDQLHKCSRSSSWWTTCC